MPAVPLHFRARCGAFVAVFIGFMFRRAKEKIMTRCRTLRPRNRLDGVIVGLTLSVIFLSNLLMRCGDIESNPGPPKLASVRQTRVSSSGGSRRVSLDRYVVNTEGNSQSGSQSGDVGGKELTLNDIMTMLTDMKSGFDAIKEDMNSRFDELKGDMKEIKESYSILEEEVQALSEEVTALKKVNISLRESNKSLQDNLNTLQAKTDDLESRSKRNNIIIHGIPRSEKETPDDCENLLKDVITDKLELTGDFAFDRVHRINSKSDSPLIARCTFYKDKVNILKAKWKLKGSNVFIGEDFSQRIRDIRKKLSTHLRDAKAAGKRATMIYDHLLIDGKKFVLGDNDSSIVEVR